MRHPSVMHVFIKRKMLCVGCSVQDCHTIADIYGYKPQSFLNTLRKAAQIEKKR